ncbi:MAG: response regulator [Desulfobacca sp.]|nr:response regulator [Desulfobacca sp.]
MQRPEILIINDGSVLLGLMGQRLEARGCRTYLANEPVQVLEIVSTKDLYLAVVGLNGKHQWLAVIHMIKEISPQMKFILVGTHELLRVAACEIEANDYITMPCSSAQLCRRLAHHLGEPWESALLKPRLSYLRSTA